MVRRVVERTFGWIFENRRFVRDDKPLTGVAQTLIVIAASATLTRRRSRSRKTFRLSGMPDVQLVRFQRPRTTAFAKAGLSTGYPALRSRCEYQDHIDRLLGQTIQPQSEEQDIGDVRRRQMTVDVIMQRMGQLAGAVAVRYDADAVSE